MWNDYDPHTSTSFAILSEGHAVLTPVGFVERIADLVLLQFAQPEGQLLPIAMLLLDVHENRLYVRARSGLHGIIPAEDDEVVTLFLAQLATDAQITKGSTLLQDLEDRLSNTIRISERTRVQFTDIDQTLDDLSQQLLPPA